MSSQLREAYGNIRHWERKLRDGLANRRRAHPATDEGKAVRRWVRHCVAQVRQWEREADRIEAIQDTERSAV